MSAASRWALARMRERSSSASLLALASSRTFLAFSLSLLVRLGDASLEVLDLAGGLGLGLGGAVEVVLDLLLTLLHHREDRGPGELGQDDPDDKEGDEGGDELRGLREQNVRTARRLGKGDRRGGEGCQGGACGARKSLRVAVHTFLQLSVCRCRRLLDDKADDEADEGECLDESGAEDEDREQTALHFRLTRHRARGAERSETDANASADDAKTITDDSHNSSFVIRRNVASF